MAKAKVGSYVIRKVSDTPGAEYQAAMVLRSGGLGKSSKWAYVGKSGTKKQAEVVAEKYRKGGGRNPPVLSKRGGGKSRVKSGAPSGGGGGGQ